MCNKTITLAIPEPDSPLWREADLWRLWSWSLFHASRKRKHARIEGLSVELTAGELAAPLSIIEKETGLKQEGVQRALLIGKNIGLWTVRFTPWWVRISIANWQ